jgi:hypothetical protein
MSGRRLAGLSKGEGGDDKVGVWGAVAHGSGVGAGSMRSKE